jgi:hypothetical protein
MGALHFPYLAGEISAKKAFVLSELGFRFGDKGAHTSRTIMTAEIGQLFEACPEDTQKRGYSKAIEDGNILGKATSSTRHLTFQRLSEVYGLDPSIPIFRHFRAFWKLENKAKPILAVMTALARDPLLRATARPVLETHPGQDISKQDVKNSLEQDARDRLNPDSLDKVLRNALSSWTQSGHLAGRSRKIRARAQASPVSTVFALLLGYFIGLRGPSLFESLFARTLDLPASELMRLAVEANGMGIVLFKQLGGIFEVSFDGILTAREKELADVSD